MLYSIRKENGGGSGELKRSVGHGRMEESQGKVKKNILKKNLSSLYGGGKKYKVGRGMEEMGGRTTVESQDVNQP